ncbi:MAG: phenylalanine--tRNA ligase subunit beta [Bacilli bacterium]|jgi:phenylalanyl-tRNA synthetase beta chain|nr:phenylalanine--tRNA ligase subunit beta [Bacilli bacterium]
MLISCNRLKKYIKDSDQIDWTSIWDLFTIRTAEVEGLKIYGKDMKDVVIAEITSCENHPTKEKYHILKVSDGTKEYSILCGAPNVRKGLKAPLVKVGGMVSGIEIAEKKIAGVQSEGMLCAMDELGIGAGHEGIMELPSDAPLGMDLKEYLPIEDIIVEIDNKSLTNRPDLWGHYGIAREIAAITKHELLDLELLEVENNQEDLDIVIKDTENCNRYCGLRVEELKNNKTPYEMQIFLHYAGMRSISLFVDLTNFVMLELGTPMHAFDNRVVKSIVVEKAKENTTFQTLDHIERKLTEDMLMIQNGQEYFGIAGVMGGLESEIESDTDAIFIESANFDATSIRKTATLLGLRTEASARYEKALDPNLALTALKRFLFLLYKENPMMKITSNLTDIYPNPISEKKIELKKERLRVYMNYEMPSTEVHEILESLGFHVSEEEDKYQIIVPTYRATKDITMSTDIIEELARMHGYENFEMIPLKLDLTFKSHENMWDEEYKVKRYLATAFQLSEVHSYLWYDSNLLNKTEVEKIGVKLLEKSENNILRDDLSFSLLPIVKRNLQNLSECNIFEIGTVIQKEENHRHLSIILANDQNKLEESYYKAKQIIESLFKTLKGIPITYQTKKEFDYEIEEVSKGILVNQECIGYLKVFKNKIANYIGKKKSIVAVEIDFDQFHRLAKQTKEFKSANKYPTVNLDYTILISLDTKYKALEDVLKEFKNSMIFSYQLIDIYHDEKEKKVTIRYTVGSEEKTLEGKELNDFKIKFMDHIRKNGFEIME